MKLRDLARRVWWRVRRRRRSGGVDTAALAPLRERYLKAMREAAEDEGESPFAAAYRKARESAR